MTNQIVQTKEQTLSKIITGDYFKQQISRALPKHLSADRFTRIALTEIRKTPLLCECDHKSFLGAIVQSSQLGLEPGSGLGHAYLIPFKNKREGIVECQLMIGYKGMLDLARRSKTISSISANVVYEKDQFNFEYGLNEKLSHIPSRDVNNSDTMIAVYAVAKFFDGGHQFVVMWKNDVDKIRSTSKSASFSSSPWATHYDEMAKKTALRRLCKYLPMSIEMQTAITIDEQADYGGQNMASVIDITPNSPFEDQAPETKAEMLTAKISGKE